LQLDAAPLASDLDTACRTWSDRVAIRTRGDSITYAQLWRRVEVLASELVRRGVGPGDRVLCSLRTNAEHIVAMHAAWHCGAIHVGVHNELTARELVELVERLEPSAVLFEPRGSDGSSGGLAAVAAVAPGMARFVHRRPAGPGEQMLAEVLAGDPAPGTAFPAVDAAADAVLFLTSGSTGRPKAVIDSLAGLRGKVAFFHEAFRPGPGDVHLLFLPICHAFGMKLATLALLSGGRLVLPERFSAPEVLELVAGEAVTVLPATPTHLSILLSHLEAGSTAPVGSLRWVPTAAAPLGGALAAQVYQRLGVEVFSVYGCSEGFLCTTTDRADVLAGSVGRRVYRGPPPTPPAGTVAVVDPQTGVAVPAGELGEITFATNGPVRYWDEPAVGGDGWYRSGDLGRLDAGGRLFVLGRRKELVNRGGLKVSPAEIESELSRHPDLRDAAVVPSADPVLGEAICACVVPAGPHCPSLNDVRAFLAPTLARHKLPDELCQLEQLPRSSIGKLDRAALAALVDGEGLPRQRLRPR